MTLPPSANKPKPLRWIGSSREDLKAFPDEVQWTFGGALWDAQIGLKARFAKPLKGFGGASVLELLDDFDGDTYRAVYTIRFAGVVYVLHAFQKKSKRGIATPRTEMALVDQRLKKAREDYEQWLRSKAESPKGMPGRTSR
jgi:phage-related protein